MNKMYIQRQPSHILLSIIRVQGELEIKKVSHEVLGELEKVSDIIFVFYKTSQLINRRKFTSLYQGCGWVDVSENLPETLMGVLEYDHEIFEDHSGILYVNLEDLGELMIPDILRLPLILGSTIGEAICKVTRLEATEFQKIYTTFPEPESFWEIIKNWVLGEKNEDDDGMYCIYKSESPAILFPTPSITRKILEFWRGNTGKSYVRTFKNFDPHYLFASLLVKIEVKILGKNFNELGI